MDAVTASGTIGLFSGKELAPGIAVKILATPADGYRMASGYPKVYRTGAPDETVPATFKPDASSGIAYLYTFTMPDSKVTVPPTFTKVADEKPSTTGYVDVASSAWYNDAIQYVTDKA